MRWARSNGSRATGAARGGNGESSRGGMRAVTTALVGEACAVDRPRPAAGVARGTTARDDERGPARRDAG